MAAEGAPESAWLTYGKDFSDPFFDFDDEVEEELETKD